jgi:hypothetical protein
MDNLQPDNFSVAHDPVAQNQKLFLAAYRKVARHIGEEQ